MRVAKSKGYCLNCLGEYHSITKCRSKTRCNECGGKHHTLLHNHNKKSGENIKSETEQNITSIPKVAAHFVNEKQAVLLATARVNIKKSMGTVTAHALINPGSQATFITSALAAKLHEKPEPISIQVTGIGSSEATVATRSVRFVITASKTKATVPVKALILDNLTDFLPATELSNSNWDHLKYVELADPDYGVPAKIDLIIGADIYPLIICEGIRKGSQGSPMGQNTIFGWILTGKICSVVSQHQYLHTHLSTCPISEVLRRFWEVEEVIPLRQNSDVDEQCEQLYKATVSRNSNGSYVVRSPFKKGLPSLGESRTIAMKRYLSTERSNIRRGYIADYYKTLEEYVSLGHMTKVHCDSLPTTGVDRYYLPHHAVIKPSSTTTKFRVVFDASCKSTNGLSLNDNLLTGPILQQDVTQIILRWRHHEYVFTADIEKMYRQVWVHPDDAKFQRILWRPTPSSEIQEYELRTVTFGINCAPYLAMRTLVQLAEDEREAFPRGSECLTNDFYVDDVLTGGDTIEEVQSLRKELTSLLASGQFPLRKFSSNHPNILKDVAENDKSREALEMQLSDTATFKTLGIYWDAKSDEFLFKIKVTKEGFWTKRLVLHSKIV